MKETIIGVSAMRVLGMPKYFLIAVVIGLLAAILLGVIVLDRVNARPELTIDSAIEQVRDAYEGEIVSVGKSDYDYQVKLKSTTGLYELIVKADGSGIAGIRRVEAYDSNGITDEGNSVEEQPANHAAEQPYQQEPVEEPDESPAPANGGGAIVQDKDTLISADKAVAIALEKVDGVMEEVELKRSRDIRYYLVEVETPDGREADVQLNAASGAIMSISWSDDDDNDDD